MTFVPGAFVQARGEPWLVARTEPFNGGSLVTLEGRGRGNHGRHLRLLTPFDRIEGVSASAIVRRRRRDEVARLALSAVRSQQPARELWSTAHASMTLLPWQLEPARAVLGGASRVLLADAVGLGKTLQAGLIVAELMARGLVDRALVLTPASLREPWARELQCRLGLHLTVFDHESLLLAQASAPVGVNPWTTAPLVVSSIDLVKRADVWAGVEGVAFDLLIVDEAHHLTPGSDRGALVARLAARIPWLVLVSATPHTGDPHAFQFLSGLGAVDETDRLVIFRRGREAAGLADDRVTHLLPVAATEAERALVEAVHDYSRRLWRGAGDRGRALALVAATLSRRAASSGLAIERTLTRRLALLGHLAAPAEAQPALPWEEREEADDEGRAEWLALPALDDLEEERRWILRLIGLAHIAQTGASKIRRLARLVHRLREPVVVFTEFRDTLEAVRGALEAHEVAVMHGGVDPRLRAEAVARFTNGDARVLLATDAAGEGLNLHHRCRLVVTMEVPWSPLRLEQRIGRVDRLGQSRRVHAIHLYHRGTIEDTVLAALARRRDRAEGELAHAIGEDMVAASVFEGRETLTHPAPPHPRTPHSRTSHPRTAHACTGHTALRTPHFPGACLWTPPRSKTARLAALVELTHVSAAGCVIERRVAALDIELASAPATRRDWRAMVGRVARDPRVAAAARAGETPPYPRWQHLVRRLDAMRAQLQPAPRLVQASLFDQRAIRAAAADRELRQRIDRHLAHRAAQLRDETGRPTPTDVRVIVAWPLTSRPGRRR